jgi:hypothetical protein
MIMTNNVKSLKKQLMAAIAMVVVAAIALSSATYAWFVNNARVTATDVSVQAATAYSLLISPKNGDDATWGTTTKLTTTLDKMTPVSTIGEVNEGENATAITLSAKTNDAAAVGIGDGTSVAVGDVRFVTNTKWESNFVTGVSEVSRSSKTADATDDDVSTYFYSDTVYLKAAQAGNIYLDSNGIGIVWAKYDESKDTKFADAELISFTEFASFNTIDTTSLSKDTTPTLEKATEYNENLTSAQALLKTMRIGLLVTQGTGTDATRTWHEYQLVSGYIDKDNAANTTLNENSGAEGITKAVSVLDSKNAVATNSSPVVKEYVSSVKTMSGKTIADYAIEGLDSSLAAATTDADLIATASVNEEIQVDIYIWMEGCDEDTVAANISSFSGTGVSGLQLGFCLGEIPTSTSE